MSAFVFGDMHGKWDSLRPLLLAAGIIDDQDLLQSDDLVISIGDLVSGTFMDTDRDLEILEKAASCVDYIVLGNHEAPYWYPHLGFAGFAPNRTVEDRLNGWLRNGKIVPALVINETLITHAGVNKAFNFQTASEAADAIEDVYANYFMYADPVPGGSRPIGGDPWQFKGQRYDRASLLDGISPDRGGRAPVAGILWDDWTKHKNTNFSQIVGHTPVKTGPVLNQHLGSGTFTLNIDAGVKKGLTPWGVWINEDGLIDDFVTVEEVVDGSDTE